MQTYLFYDIETTGLNKAFDQMLHFAAIRTDLQFKELERIDIKIKLNPDVTPSPYAMLTHQMHLHDISEGLCEYEAIKQIHQWMNTPGTISLGYNTLSFDDEFLRFSFYRNLLPPYTHQFANQCSRMDIYPITIMYFLFKNSVLQWPEKDGKLSFKLEELNKANQFVTGRAHHAMVDVEATLALTKKLAEAHDMWEYISGYFNKKSEQERLQKLESDEALMILGKFGSEKSFQSIVLSLGNHYHYSNQFLWLRLDDKDFSGMTIENFLDNTYVLSKKLAEPGFLLPLKERFTKHLNTDRLALAKANKQWLAENPTLFKQISEHYLSYKYPVLPETDVDASLYLNGFWSNQEETFCKTWLNATPQKKSQLAETITPTRLRALAIRILGRNFPEVLTPEQAEEFAEYIRRARNPNDAQAIIDFKGGKRLTPKVALEQIAELRMTHAGDSEKLKLLDELETELQRQ